MTLRKILAITLLLAFGFLRLPYERKIDIEKQNAHFLRPAPSQELREQIGQTGFLAAFGGFRSLLAALLWIDAYSAWEKTDWARMNTLFQAVTTLQPRSLLYWDMASWHMAWNASAAASLNPKQPSEALRLRAQRQYWDIGKDFLERGIRNNPDQYPLYERLAILLRDKYQDFYAASLAFEKAASLPQSPAYLPRFAAYTLALAPGKEKEAYQKLYAIYQKETPPRPPAVLLHLQELEEKLGIPTEKRVKPGNKTSAN